KTTRCFRASGTVARCTLLRWFRRMPGRRAIQSPFKLGRIGTTYLLRKARRRKVDAAQRSKAGLLIPQWTPFETRLLAEVAPGRIRTSDRGLSRGRERERGANGRSTGISWLVLWCACHDWDHGLD